jgi:PhnB protein
MAVLLNPYLTFRDTAREAMEHYQAVFGGELTVMSFADMHASEDPAEQAKVMHAMLIAPDGITLMGADTPNTMELGTNGSVSLSGDDEARLRGFWDALVEGGTVTVPLEKAPWGDTFGMLTDRHGISWMVNVAGSPA